jgi:hypothetical protein
MKRALFSMAVAALVCGGISSRSEAAPMGPVLAPVAAGMNSAVPVYYYGGVYFPYYYHGHYYRYHHNHHYYKHRYYRSGRYYYS